MGDSMKGQIFRIAHLGNFDFSDVFSLIACLQIILEYGQTGAVRVRCGCCAAGLYGCGRWEGGQRCLADYSPFMFWAGRGPALTRLRQ